MRSGRSALGAYDQRICARMDKPRAVTAAAHKLDQLVCAMRTQGQENTDRGQDCLEERYRQRVSHNLAQKARAMGMQLVPSDNTASKHHENQSVVWCFLRGVTSALDTSYLYLAAVMNSPKVSHHTMTLV